MNALRNLLWAIATVLAAVVGVRMLWGPYSLAGIVVNTPLNPEGVFGLLIVALLLFPPRVELTWAIRALPHKPRSPLPWIALTIGTIVALSPALRVYFVSDDFNLIRQTQSFSASVFTSAGGDGFFRPLGYVSLVINAWIAGIDPVWWHLSALTLHAINALLVALLAERMGAGRRIALVAGGLFALHGTHLEAAVWIAGRFDLLAALFTLATLLFYERNTAIALLSTIAALWSKEAAFVLPLLLAILARWERRSLKTVIPFAALSALAFLYRWMLLGGIGGYRESTGESAFLSLKFATTAKAVFVRLWTSLFFPINWSMDPSVIVALFAIAYIAALLWLAWRGGHPGLGWILLALGVSILPPLHLLGGAADLSGGRLLYLPSIWFCVLLAFAAGNLPKREAVLVWAALLLFHFAAMQHDLGFWRSTSQQVREICASPNPPANPPTMIDGVPALANGFADCIELSKRLQ